MQSLVIIIILLSFIGFYINLGSVSNLTKPEFSKKDDETLNSKKEDNMSPDEIASQIMKEVNKEPKFDSMGNPIEKTGGLEAGKEIINLQVEAGAAPDTRPQGWARPSSSVIQKYGLSETNLSYKNNYPYDINYVAPVNAEEVLDNKINNNILGKVAAKATANVSKILLPKDPSKIAEGMGFFQRADAIIRNQISNENKTLIYLGQVDEKEITNRASKKITRVDKDHIEIKNKPDGTSFQGERNKKIAHDKVKTHDESRHAINSMKTNYNLK